MTPLGILIWVRVSKLKKEQDARDWVDKERERELK
jgi:hypothetical protein